jgi:hypothetical protein
MLVLEIPLGTELHDDDEVPGAPWCQPTNMLLGYSKSTINLNEFDVSTRNIQTYS